MKIATIIGARPQFIKASTVSRAIAAHNARVPSAPQTDNQSQITEHIIHTGQHFDENMSQVFFDELEIPRPDYHLGVSGGGHGQMTGAMLEKLEPLLEEICPDWVLVYGDTNSTLAGALAAAKLHIPVAHVEAGLRSYNRKMPEEINRILTDQLSTILFCPTENAVQNLHKEGFPHQISINENYLITSNHSQLTDNQQLITNVGDVMYDAALYYAKHAEARSQILNAYGLERKKYVLATVHRAENSDHSERLRAIMNGLEDVAKQMPVLFPLHPRTRTALERENITTNYLTLIDPVGYLDMVALETNAAVIVTDSGGLQKEAYFHGVPCVTLRDETEWVELVDGGWNVLTLPEIAEMVEKNIKSIGKLGN